jgi:PAS domain S-box-containing protein
MERMFNLADAAGSCPADPASYAKRLRLILDALPTGIVLAEAPSGRIIEGNQSIEMILRHPVLYSRDTEAYREWVAFHEDGRQVQGHEYPLARALAGKEVRPELECRYLRPDGTFIWIKIVGSALCDDSGKVIGAVVSVTDIDDLKRAEEQHRLMSLELHHRVNNALSMVQAIANLSARAANDVDSFRSSFSGRVHSLSRTQLLLSKNSWEHIALSDLVDSELELKQNKERFVLSGKPVSLRSQVALAFGLALHELKSNAEKFGALSCASGVVTLSWHCEAADGRQKLFLDWREIGGPPAMEPGSGGLGLYLLRSALAQQLEGSIDLEFGQEGLRARIVATL